MLRIRGFNTILDECLAAVFRGESVAACLARYPKHANRLRPLLTLAEKVNKTPQVAARPLAEQTAWNRVRQRAGDLRSRRRRPRAGMNYGAWLRPVALAAALVMAITTGGGVTALASQNALPDSPLYRVKLATEDARLWIVFDDAREAEILMDQSDERSSEIRELVNGGKPISGNVLAALKNRNGRAADIVIGLDDPELRQRLTNQSADQASSLIEDYRFHIADSAKPRYYEAVASVHNTRLLVEGGFVATIRPEDLAGGIQVIDGLAAAIGDGIWNVGGFEVRIDDQRTIGSEGLKDGDTARFIVGRSSTGRRLALSLSPLRVDRPSEGSVVKGEVDEVTDDGIWIAGQFIPFDTNTLGSLDIKRGQEVEVEVSSQGSTVAATSVSLVDKAILKFEGTFEGEVGNSGKWEIGGQTFTIPQNARIDSTAGPVDDGSRLVVAASSAGGDWIADSVTVLASDASEDSIHIIGVFERTKNDLWLISGLEVVAPEAPEPDAGSLVAIEARLDGQETVGLSAIAIKTPDEGRLIEISGAIQSIDGSLWTLEPAPVRVTSTAEVSGGDPLVGARVLVWGRSEPDGTLVATYARVLDQLPVINSALDEGNE